MLIFIAWDGDHIGREVGRASLDDDVEGLRRISQAIDLGNNIWRSWVELKGGCLISMGGDEGRAQVPASVIDELPAIREQYAGAVNAPVSVGVGMKLSEADKALLAAKLTGGDKITFYTEDAEAVIAKAKEHGEKTEESKIADEYLNKAAPAMNPGAFAGAARATAPSVQKPVSTQGDSSEMDALNGVLGDENAPGPAEMTHAGKDFERQLHEEAWKGEEEDMAGQAQSKDNIEAIKAQVVQSLQALKAQGPVLEQVKQVAPGAYKAMMGLAQSVIGLARELSPSQPMAKAEGDNDKTAKMTEAVRDAHSGTDRGKVDLEHCAKGDCYEQVEALHHLLGGDASGFAPHHLFHGSFGPHWFLKDGKGRILDPMADTHHEPLPYDKGLPSKFLAKVPSKGAQEVIDKILGFSQPEGMAKADKQQSINLIHYGKVGGLKRIDVNKMGTGAPGAEYKQGTPEVGRAYYYREGTTPEPLVTQGAKAIYDAKLDPAQHRLYDIGADPEGLRQPARERFLAGEGLDSPDDTFLDSVRGKGYYGYHNSASAMPGTVALFHPHPVKMRKEELKSEADPSQPVKEGEDLEKMKLPMPKASAHHHVVLPPGSQVDDKIKVTHQDGKSSWKQVSAGQIRSQDPAGHATSSRSPNSK
jgi:hypothetical protein